MTFEELLKNSPVIKKAFNFSKKAHAGQKRKNGEPYFNHPLAAAKTIIEEWKFDDPATIAAALLHDVAEDTPHDINEIKRDFDEEIAFLVDGVTKLGHVKYRGVGTRVENMRKFILALSKDIRVLLIKLADRLHNMRTLNALPPQKQKRIALETTEIYAPLAYRLGMFSVSGELEDLAFPYIYPQEHKWLLENVKEKFEERERYAKKIIPIITEELKNNNILLTKIDFRAKRYASLYKKLLKHEMNLDDIYDLVAVRAIVPTIENCYNALGVVHKIWQPLPNRIKDYIALPKINGYKSLHTTIFGPEQRIIEIQIRTPEMHEVAENGIAAHWAYQKNRASIVASTQELSLVQKLRNWQTNKDYNLEDLKIDFFKDRIMVLTPKGEVIDLPQGSTPVDFAYQIHSEIGNHCIGAKINGKIVSLDTKLKSGDLIEILIQKNKLPSESWLSFVKTSHAKNHIRSALKYKKMGILRHENTQTELKIVVEDRIGILNDITKIIARSHINIMSHQSQFAVKNKFKTVKIVCNLINKDKLEKLIIKLKEIKGVKSIEHHFI